MSIVKIGVGDVITVKKAHPCGSHEFTVLRTGTDIRIKCTRCGRDIILSREKVEKAIRSVRPSENNQ